MPSTIRVIAYVRVSTQPQLEGYGIDLQLDRIRTYAKARGFRIAKIFREAASGVGPLSISDRPQLRNAIALAKSKRRPILISEVDRAGRHAESVLDLFEEPDLKLISVDNGEAADRAVLEAQAHDAERRAKIISATTKAALKLKKKQDIPLGNRKNLSEAQQMGASSNRDRFQKRAEEYLLILRRIDPARIRTRKDIADVLNKMGHRTDRGLEWNPNNFRRLHEEIERLWLESSSTSDNVREPSFEERQKQDPLWGRYA